MPRPSRRAIVATPLALAVAKVAQAAATPIPSAWPDATQTAALIRTGQASPLALVQTAIDKAERLQPALGAINNSDFDRALDRAKGPLSGPFAGVPLMAGAGPHAAYDALGFVSLGTSASIPLARNPWRPARGGGGAAAGAAAAVATGVAPIACASEVGGGLRWAASVNGLFGLKPSRARMADGAQRRQLSDHGVSHVLSRSVRDSQAIFVALQDSGPHAAFPPIALMAKPGGKRLRIGVVSQSITHQAPTAEVMAALDDAAGLLTSLGHHLIPTVWPAPPEFLADFFALSTPEAPAALHRIYRDVVAYDPWFVGHQFDLIVSPVQGDTSAPVASLASEDHSYTAYHNIVGAPAMSVPVHWTAQGLPIGVQVFGRVGAEAALFDLAYQLETARPWAWHHPTLS